MGKFASGLYLIAATACYVLAAINIHLLLERGEPLAWVNFALAVVLGVAGIVLSCLAARSAQTEVVRLWVDEPGSIDERSWRRLDALKGDADVFESEARKQRDWGFAIEASREEFQEHIENNTEELCKAVGIPYRKL